MVVGELAQERDILIIGGGPGGYQAAIRAAQLGLQVSLIEKGNLGGVCLNEGCIPSKIHTAAAQQFQQIESLKKMGIQIENATFDLPVMQEHKSSTIRHLKQGILNLCKAHNVEIISGMATFLTSNKIGVENGHQYDTYVFKQAIIATGSKKVPLIEEVEGALTPASIWNLDMVPSHLILFGSDDITLEAAMCFRAIGSQVTLIFPPMHNELSFDSSINRELTRQLKKQRIKIMKSTETPNYKKMDQGWEVTFLTADRKSQTVSGSHFYIAARNEPYLSNLGLNRAGIKVNGDGFIDIDSACQTNMPGIYAIGDITDGPSLAVKAIKQGKVAAENIAGISSEADLTFIPRIVQTIPPIASVGLTEQQALEKGFELDIGESSLQSNGYAAILGQKDGMVKTITDRHTKILLGVHIIGIGALELITSGTIALEMVAREEDLLFPLYPHPSINESILEASEDIDEKAIHKAPAKKNIKYQLGNATFTQ